MGRLIIDGHDVYEIDERCLEEHKIDKKCEILKKIENAKKENDPKSQWNIFPEMPTVLFRLKNAI